MFIRELQRSYRWRAKREWPRQKREQGFFEVAIGELPRAAQVVDERIVIPKRVRQKT